MKRILALLGVCFLCLVSYTLGRQPGSPDIAGWLQGQMQVLTSEEGRQWFQRVGQAGQRAWESARSEVIIEQVQPKGDAEVASLPARQSEPEELPPVPQCW